MSATPTAPLLETPAAAVHGASIAIATAIAQRRQLQRPDRPDQDQPDDGQQIDPAAADADSVSRVAQHAPSPAPEPELKPIIAELLRTRLCPPGSVFLVEGVDSGLPVGSGSGNRYRAVRLLLGDGQLCLQALLRGEVHGFVDRELVQPGCYVRLESFSLRFFAVGGTPGGEAKNGDRQQGNGGKQKGMAYLVVDDLDVLGWSSTYLDLLETEDTGLPRSSGAGGAADSSGEDSAPERKEAEGEDKTPVGRESSRVEAPHPREENMAVRTVSARNNPDPEGGDDEEDIFEVMDVSSAKKTQQRDKATGRDARHHAQPPLKKGAGAAAAPGATPSSASLPWTSSDPTQPLRLTTLRSIPNLPYKQNWTVNVLAVVASLSEVEPSALPPHSQRSARLADPSTGKRVLLTVFLDPADFRPRVGSVVLLVGVKNHRFDGGSLKKYASDRPRVPGVPWWFEDPWELGWCDVAGLRRWWDAQQAPQR